MSNELTVVEQNSLAVMPVINMQVAKERRDQMVSFVREIMIDGTDFGIIPSTNKPTLYKPGAEKLCTFFGLIKRFEIIERVEDWTGADHNGELFFYYLYRCGLYRGNQLIAESDGSCNSFESKYRYRKAERVCPTCGEANIRKSKDNKNKDNKNKDNKNKDNKKGGWYCWQKTGGCGATFSDNDARITEQETGRILNPDVCDLVNTIQKMAQKRALVAATLLAVNASEFFTQDLEDYVEGSYIETPSQPEVSLTKQEVEAMTRKRALAQAMSSPPPQHAAINAPIPPQKTVDKPKLTRPLSPEQLKESMQIKAGKYTGPANEKQLKYARASLDKVCDGNEANRHAIGYYLFGEESSKEWTGGECSAIIEWIGARADNDYTPIDEARQEAHALLEMLNEDAEIDQGRPPDEDEILF